MATISGAQARYQLSATGSLTGNNVSGSATIGTGLGTRNYANADIAYVVKITSNAASDVATLNLASGAVVQTTGTPDVTRWGSQVADLAGNDIEGIALATATRVNAILLEFDSTMDGTITVASSNSEMPDFATDLDDQKMPIILSDTGLISPGTMAFTFSTDGDRVTATVIGQSS